MNDVLGEVPDTAPMMIWNDQVQLKWTEDEREMLAEMGDYMVRCPPSPLATNIHAATPSNQVMVLHGMGDCHP
jgi:hypothetical protein